MSTKPYQFIGFGAMDVTKPYKCKGFGAIKPYQFIRFGAMDVTKPYPDYSRELLPVQQAGSYSRGLLQQAGS
jgi:hypothetical protein